MTNRYKPVLFQGNVPNDRRKPRADKLGSWVERANANLPITKSNFTRSNHLFKYYGHMVSHKFVLSLLSPSRFYELISSPLLSFGSPDAPAPAHLFSMSIPSIFVEQSVKNIKKNHVNCSRHSNHPHLPDSSSACRQLSSIIHPSVMRFCSPVSHAMIVAFKNSLYFHFILAHSIYIYMHIRICIL